MKKLKELILKKLQDVLLIRKIISIEYIQKYAKDTLLLLTRVFWTVTKSKKRVQGFRFLMSESVFETLCEFVSEARPPSYSPFLMKWIEKSNVLWYFIRERWIKDMWFGLLVEPNWFFLYRYKYFLVLSFRLAKQMLEPFRSYIWHCIFSMCNWHRQRLLGLRIVQKRLFRILLLKLVLFFLGFLSFTVEKKLKLTLFQSNLSWNIFSAKSSLHTRCTRCLEYKYMYVFIAVLNRASRTDFVRIHRSAVH